MDMESIRLIMEGTAYISVGSVGVYCACRYVLGPLVGYGHVDAALPLPESPDMGID